MIQTDNIDLAFEPLRTEGITRRAIREFTAEMPCACAVTDGKMCESCFCRIQVEEYSG